MSTDKEALIAKDWPKASQFRKSIRYEFARYVSVTILALMLVTGYVISSQYVKSVTQSIVDKLLVQARSYSGPAGKLIISGGGPDALLLNNLCSKLINDNADVYWAGITDADGVFLAHTDIKHVISHSRMRPVSADQFRDVLRPREGFSIEGDTIFISVSIDEKELVVGNLAVAASASPIRKARMTSVITVGSITVAMIVIGIPITVAMVRRKLRPMAVITDHLKAVDFSDISFDIPIKSRNEFGFLAETLRVMGSKLNVAQKELIEKERMTRELEIAREIQANILPRGYPDVLEVRLAGAYRSARQVGGDYYDFIEFDDDTLGILIADVSGKSLPGMLVMLLTRDIVKRLTRSIRDPARLLTEANGELRTSIKKGMFVTMFFGVLDRRTGRFRFASAGHNPLIFMKKATGEVQMTKTKGFPLGLVDSAVYGERIESGGIFLSEGDWVILYTDGVNEAQDPSGEEFGLDRVTEIVAANLGLEPQEMVETILKRQEAFVGGAPQYDDITLLAIKWVGKAADIKLMEMGEARNVG
jgi:serine phosphatase RsbU (regulator of sigma subunit)